MIPVSVPHSSSGRLVDTAWLCEVADELGVEYELVRRLTQARHFLPFDLWIFSGARSAAEQARVSELPFARSTHADTDAAGCARLATGADVQPVSPGVRVDKTSVLMMGAEFVRAGLRWGGGAPVDDIGIPVGVERWHVDLGPRT